MTTNINPRDIHCGHCEATPGSDCVTPSGRKARKMHEQRLMEVAGTTEVMTDSNKHDDLDFPLSELIHALYINNLHKVNNTITRNGYFPLDDMYSLLGEVDGQYPVLKTQFNEALLELVDSGKFSLVQETNQKDLTQRQRDLAVEYGDNFTHYLVMK